MKLGLSELPDPPTTRDRIIVAALELFGERSYSGASITMIERAAGLSPGAGGLYRHFSSKEELLVEAVRRCLTDWGPFAEFATPGFSAATVIEAMMPDATLAEKVEQCGRIGLIRGDHIRDVTRILLRDNSVPIGVLDTFRTEDHDILIGLAERTIRDFAHDTDSAIDWRPTAEVLVGATSFIWLMRDIYGTNEPCGIDIDAYMAATGAAIAARISELAR